MKNQGFRKPHRMRRKKSILKNSFFWIALGITILIFLLSYFLFFSDFFRIRNIEISGNQKTETQIIENLIERDKNIFLFNSEKNKENILNNIFQITQVGINKKLPCILKIEIEEREPVAVVCQNECFYIDKQGMVFERTTEDGQIPKINNLNLQKDLKLGDKVLDEENLNQILIIESAFKKDLGILVGSMELASERRLNVFTSQGWQAYFDIQKDISWQITELKSILEKEIPLEKREKLKYIDLRFEKVYVFPESIFD